MLGNSSFLAKGGLHQVFSIFQVDFMMFIQCMLWVWADFRLLVPSILGQTSCLTRHLLFLLDILHDDLATSSSSLGGLQDFLEILLGRLEACDRHVFILSMADFIKCWPCFLQARVDFILCSPSL